MGTEFSSAAHPFTFPDGLFEGDINQVTMEHLYKCLDEEWPATLPGHDELKCVLECLKEFSSSL